MKFKKKNIENYIRVVMQILCFVLFPSAYSAAFSGCRYLFAQIGAGEHLELNSLLAVALVLLGYTIVFGRFFCGFACAFGALGDGVHWLYQTCSKKIHRKPRKFPSKIDNRLYILKYFVLLFYLGMAYFGLYDRLHGSSPWTVFSQLHELKFNPGDYPVGVVLLVLIIIGMCLSPRFFCKALCPMGAVFSLMPVLPWSSLRRHEESCIKGCSACTRCCPANIELPYETGDTRGECFQCQKCVVTCPKGNVDYGKTRSQSVRIAILLVKCTILIGLFIWLGV